MAPGLGPDYLAQLTPRMLMLMLMTPQEKAEYTARMLIEESETLGKGHQKDQSEEVGSHRGDGKEILCGKEISPGNALLPNMLVVQTCRGA